MKIHTGSRPSKRPKPVFNDGRKLDNSVDWETIKIAKPPPEDLSDSKAAKETTITDRGMTTPASEGDALKHMKSKTIKKLEIIRKELDMCRYNLQSTDDKGTGLVQKSTSLITNSATMGEHLARKCLGGHRHVHLKGGTRATAAATYTSEFCSAVVEAYRLHKQQAQARQGCVDDVMTNGSRSSRSACRRRVASLMKS